MKRNSQEKGGDVTAAGTWVRSLELLVTHRLYLAALPGSRWLV
jgi:hypothetical protein